jgi:cytochrome P450
MWTGKTYVVADPVLAVAVQRASSTLDFDEMVAQFISRIVKLNSHTTRILQDPTAKQEGRKRMVSSAHSLINPPFAAHNVWGVSQAQLEHFSDHVNSLEDGKEIGLYEAVTRQIAAATMSSLYGPENPFALNPELIQKWWEWDDDNVGYAVSPFPQITNRKAYLAMEACVQGWLEYTEKGRHSQAQPFLKERYEMHKNHGISDSEHARLEMGIGLAFISNASVTMFWVINNIFSRPDLLKELREEIYTHAFESPGTISGSKLKEHCHLLNSVYRETMRLKAPMTSARVVLEDTIIADTYSLKKGSVVQISGGILNHDPEVWGPDVSSFNPRRFYYSSNGTKTNADGTMTDSKANTVHPAAFRGFGGGTTLCPGRHFAQIEVTGLAALMVMAFDMHPPKETNNIDWDPPTIDSSPLVVNKPTREVRVKLVKRKGYEDVKWDLKV